MKIYDLPTVYQQLVDNSDQYDEQLLKDTLETISMEVEDQVTDLIKTIKAIEGSVDAIGNEIKRLQDRKKSMENTVESLKKHITDVMVKTDTQKFKNEFFTVWVQKGTMKVLNHDIEKVPDEFVKYEATLKKSDVIKAYKEKLKAWEEEKKLAEKAGIDFNEPQPTIEGVEFGEGDKGVRYR